MTSTGLRRLRPIVATVVGIFLLHPTPGYPADAQAGGEAVTERLHGVRIGDGERLVLSIDDKGAPKIVTRGSAPKDASTLPPVNDTRVETAFHVRAPPISAEPDTLVATFQAFGPQGATLKIENGFAHPIIYDAQIIRAQGQDLVASSTSICPVRAKGLGVEAWGGSVAGIILSNPREPPGDDMHCSGDAGLIAGGPPGKSNICIGEAKDSPVQVRLSVDPSTGDRLGAEATWILRDRRGGEMAPMLMLGFPMQNEIVAGRPVNAGVLAVASVDPKPTSKAASIVILADGVEAVRRPWRLYSQRLESLGQAPPGSRPVAFVGMVPFPLYSESGSADPQLAALYAAIGDGRVRRLDVRVEGDDGVMLSHASFALSSQDIRNADRVAAALHDADGKRAAPGHCAAPAQAAGGK